jgi:small subunit ribosomal protein S6
MPVNSYECLFLLDSSKVAGDVPGAVASLHAVFDKHKVEILASRPWEDRKLAYPIQGQKKGLYYLMFVRAESRHMATIEHDFKLNENILRMQMINIHPKWADTMLTLAKDEHALALPAGRDDSVEAAAAELMPNRPIGEKD